MQARLCQTCSKTTLLVFSRGGSLFTLFILQRPMQLRTTNTDKINMSRLGVNAGLEPTCHKILIYGKLFRQVFASYGLTLIASALVIPGHNGCLWISSMVKWLLYASSYISVEHTLHVFAQIFFFITKSSKTVYAIICTCSFVYQYEKENLYFSKISWPCVSVSSMMAD